jgi:hypothetical protein
MQHAKSSMAEVFRADFVVWTSYNVLCYGRIPLRLQPVSTAFMSAAWSAYISCVATGPSAAVEPPPAALPR